MTDKQIRRMRKNAAVAAELSVVYSLLGRIMEKLDAKDKQAMVQMEHLCLAIREPYEWREPIKTPVSSQADLFCQEEP